MVKQFCSWLLYKHLGWTKNVTVEHPDKFIICYAPHTSNYDFFLAKLYLWAEGMKSHYLMKKDWFFWPLGSVLRHTGGIPVDRSRNNHLTDQLAEAAGKMNKFHLTITPEGTRSYTTHWKRGFYYISQKAGIPILLYGVDYEKKLIVCTRCFTPTGDVDKDMKEIKEYYKDFKGKHPEKFGI